MSQDTTKLILIASRGNRDAVDALLPLVYDELRAMAARQLQRERSDHTLQPTALVNEAFLRLADQSQVNWQGRAHFCAIAAKMWTLTSFRRFAPLPHFGPRTDGVRT